MADMMNYSIKMTMKKNMDFEMDNVMELHRSMKRYLTKIMIKHKRRNCKQTSWEITVIIISLLLKRIQEFKRLEHLSLII